HVQERCYGADRVGAPAESEKENAVALLKIFHNEDIRITNVGFETVAKCHAEEARHRARALRERAGRLHRAEAGVLVGDLLSGVASQREEQLDHIGAVLRELVSRSVAAEN